MPPARADLGGYTVVAVAARGSNSEWLRAEAFIPAGFPNPPNFGSSRPIATEDIAQRMTDLDGYLRALLASPAVALSPLVCTFLDAIDVTSFRYSMLPRLQQMHDEAAAAEPQLAPMMLDSDQNQATPS